jgi:hypothetical protein
VNGMAVTRGGSTAQRWAMVDNRLQVRQFRHSEVTAEEKLRRLSEREPAAARVRPLSWVAQGTGQPSAWAHIEKG